MKQHLEHVAAYMNWIDESPERAMQFMVLVNKTDKVLRNLLVTAITHLDNPRTAEEIDSKVRKITEYLDLHFHAYTWPTHDCHFHTSFEQYLNCPFTCASEVSECVVKILNEMYTA